MAIDDRLDAAEERIAAERRAESPVTRYVRDVSEIMNAVPSELVPTWLVPAADGLKAVFKTVAWSLRKIEDGRRAYLVEVVVEELRRVRDQVEHMSDEHLRFMQDEFPSLVLDGLQKAERTRARDRIERIGKVLGTSARNGPSVSSDEVEELLRVSMELDDTDVRVLAALVKGQRDLLSRSTGLVTAGRVNKYWQGAGRISESGVSEIAESIGISDGMLQSSCSKLQAYGLLVQVERDESKLRRGTILYAILPRAVTFVDAIAGETLAKRA